MIYRGDIERVIVSGTILEDVSELKIIQDVYVNPFEKTLKWKNVANLRSFDVTIIKKYQFSCRSFC